MVASLGGFGEKMAGAGILSGVPLPLVRQVDLAPTVARLLGFEMPDVDGVSIVWVLSSAGR